MQAIEDLEPVRRGVYCGAVGWIDGDAGRAELAVAIRTFTIVPGATYLGVGGGIVADSSPDAEWAETELKAARLLRRGRGRRGRRGHPMIIWLDGALVPLEDARISPLDHGLTVGDGVFETMRVYDGVPFAWRRHLDRLAVSASGLGLELPDVAALRAAAADGHRRERPARRALAADRHRWPRASGIVATRRRPTASCSSSQRRWNRRPRRSTSWSCPGPATSAARPPD